MWLVARSGIFQALESFLENSTPVQSAGSKPGPLVTAIASIDKCSFTAAPKLSEKKSVASAEFAEKIVWGLPEDFFSGNFARAPSNAWRKIIGRFFSCSRLA